MEMTNQPRMNGTRCFVLERTKGVSAAKSQTPPTAQYVQGATQVTNGNNVIQAGVIAQDLNNDGDTSDFINGWDAIDAPAA